MKKFLRSVIGGTHKTRSAATQTKRTARPSLEALEDRLVLSGTTAAVTAATLLPQFLNGMVSILQQKGPNVTANDFASLPTNVLSQAMNRDPVTRQIGQMNSLQAYNLVMNNPAINRAMLQRDPVTHLSPVDVYGFTTPLQYQAVANDVASMSHGATDINWLGVADKYGIKGYLPGAGYAQDSAYQALGYLQYGASFFARRPDGSMAKPSDYSNLPYNNNGVFDPTKINYSNPYDNPWNGPSSHVATAAPTRPASGLTYGYGAQVAMPAVGWRATQTAAPAYYATPSYASWRPF